MRFHADSALTWSASCLVFLSACAAPTVSAEVDYTQLEPDGEIALTNAGNPVVRNTLADIGIEDDEGAVGGRVDFKWGSPHLTLSTTSGEWDGDGTVTDFGNIAGANVAVATDLELALHRAVLTFDLLPTSNFELGVGFGVTAMDVRARLEDIDPITPTAFVEKIDEVLPIPTLAVRVGFEVWRVGIEGMVSGLKADIDGDEATYVDADLCARLRLFGAGPVDGILVGGYRYTDIDAEYDDGGDRVEVDVTFDGPYAGLRISF